MGWRSVIISQHAKLSYSSRNMVVQTDDGINQIPLDDIDFNDSGGYYDHVN